MSKDETICKDVIKWPVGSKILRVHTGEMVEFHKAVLLAAYGISEMESYLPSSQEAVSDERLQEIVKRYIDRVHYVTLEITDVRTVKGCYTGQYYWGYRAKSLQDGRVFAHNWNIYDEGGQLGSTDIWRCTDRSRRFTKTLSPLNDAPDWRARPAKPFFEAVQAHFKEVSGVTVHYCDHPLDESFRHLAGGNWQGLIHASFGGFTDTPECMWCEMEKAEIV